MDLIEVYFPNHLGVCPPNTEMKRLFEHRRDVGNVK